MFLTLESWGIDDLAKWYANYEMVIFLCMFFQNLLQNENLKTSALNEEIETYKAYLLSPSVDINLDNSVDGSFE